MDSTASVNQQPLPNKVDVVIVGSGLNGLCCRVALEHLPLNVLLLERSPQPLNPGKINDHRQIILSASSQAILNGIGVWQDLEPHSLALPMVHVSAEKTHGQATCRAREVGLDYLGYVIPAHVILSTLQNHTHGYSNVTYGSSIDHIEMMGSGLSLTIRRGDETFQCQTALLIGADGQNSSVRKQWGIGWSEEVHETASLVIPCLLDKPLPAVAQQRFVGEAIWACVPTSQGHATFVVTSHQADIQKLNDMDPESLCQHVAKTWQHLFSKVTQLADKPQYFPGNICWAEKPVAPSTILMGNAAQVLPPVAAQGFNLGLRGAAWIAEHVIECLASGKHLGDALQLAKFQRQRDKDRKLMFNSTSSLLSSITHGHLRHRWIREIGLTAMEIFPLLKQQVSRWGLGQLSRMPALARGMCVQEVMHMRGLTSSQRHKQSEEVSSSRMCY